MVNSKWYCYLCEQRVYDLYDVEFVNIQVEGTDFMHREFAHHHCIDKAEKEGKVKR